MKLSLSFSLDTTVAGGVQKKNPFLFLEVKTERQKAADLGACQENTYVSEFFDQKFELPQKNSQWSTSKCRHDPDLGKDNPPKLQETISRRSEGVGSPYFVRKSVVEGIFDSENFGCSILPDGTLLVADYLKIYLCYQ